MVCISCKFGVPGCSAVVGDVAYKSCVCHCLLKQLPLTLNNVNLMLLPKGYSAALRPLTLAEAVMLFQGDKSRRGLSDLQQMQFILARTATAVWQSSPRPMLRIFSVFGTTTNAVRCAPVTPDRRQAPAGLVGWTAAAAHRTGAAAAGLVGWAAAAAHWARTAAWHCKAMSMRICI